MESTIGKVRLLPPSTAGLPPSVPWQPPDGYRSSVVCGAEIAPPNETTREIVGVENRWAVSFYCTRPPHSEEEIHVCHYRRARDFDPDAPLHVLIVWGGE